MDSKCALTPPHTHTTIAIKGGRYNHCFLTVTSTFCPTIILCQSMVWPPPTLCFGMILSLGYRIGMKVAHCRKASNSGQALCHSQAPSPLFPVQKCHYSSTVCAVPQLQQHCVTAQYQALLCPRQHTLLPLLICLVIKATSLLPKHQEGNDRSTALQYYLQTHQIDQLRFFFNLNATSCRPFHVNNSQIIKAGN